MKEIKENFLQVIKGVLYTYIRYYDVKTDTFKRIAVVGKEIWASTIKNGVVRVFRGGWQKYLVLWVENDLVMAIPVKPVQLLYGRKSFLLEMNLDELGYIYVYENRNFKSFELDVDVKRNKIKIEQVGDCKRYRYDNHKYFYVENNMVLRCEE